MNESIPFGPRAALLMLITAMITLGSSIATQAAGNDEYLWSPEGLYNGTHPTSPNPWSTQWVQNPDGSKSIQVTVTRGTGYYNYVVIPASRLKKGATDFTAEITFRIAASTELPRTFFMFARNSKSQAYDLWQRWVGEPGPARTIRFPMQLIPIEGGTWTIYMGCQGLGSIIIDKLVIKPGRDLVLEQPQADVTPSTTVPTDIPVATGYHDITIDLPLADGKTTVLSSEGKLIADGNEPVSNEIAQANSVAMQRLINEAKKTQGTKTLLIPKGIYRFANKSAWMVDGIDDLTIDAQGSEFIFQNLYFGECFLIMHCNRLLIKDLYLDWNWDYKPIASIGTVKRLSEDGMTVAFEFADLNAQQTLQTSQSAWMGYYPIDPVTLYRSYRIEPQKLAQGKTTALQAEGNSITATFSAPMGFEVGTSYSIRHLYYNLTAFKMASCTHLTFDGITIYSMPGMGWLNTGTTHHWRFNNCNIIRRPGSRHPLTTAADGIHAGESKGDLIIENCTFTGLGDDAINLHDNAWEGGLKPGANDKQLVLLNCPKHRLRIESGDVLKFFNADYSPAGVELTVADEPTYEGKPNAYAPTTTTTINFTSAVPRDLSYLSIVINTRFGTDNVKIADNRFIQTFGRGILFAGNDVTIENNTFHEVFGNPIQIQADIVDNHWAEGYGTSNLVLRKNVFKDTNLSGRWEGAIVYVGGRLPWGPTEYQLFSRFLVEDNHFINAPGPAMSFASSRDFLIRNNTIELSRPFPNQTPYAGTMIANLSSNMAMQNNTWKFNAIPVSPTGVIHDPHSSSRIQISGNRLVTGQ